MSDRTTFPTAPQKNADYEAVLAQIFSEINLLNERMQQDRHEIDRLKAESAHLEAETRAILIRLQGMM